MTGPPVTTNIKNDITPRRAMGPARNRRRPNWPVPIAHRGGSAEVARKFYFLINYHGQIVFWPWPTHNEAWKPALVCRDFLIEHTWL